MIDVGGDAAAAPGEDGSGQGADVGGVHHPVAVGVAAHELRRAWPRGK
jgi:hypothetical protein